MIENRLYRSKKNGRVYRCFYKSEYTGACSIMPLNPTETEKAIFPFPHLRIEYNPNDWILLPEDYNHEKNNTTATLDEIECLGALYLIKNTPL